MMSTMYLMYLVAGISTTVVTMRVFPPMEGFQPSVGVRTLAAIVFMVFWPILLLLAIWYLSVGYLQRAIGAREPMSSMELDLQTPSIGSAASKPR